MSLLNRLFKPKKRDASPQNTMAAALREKDAAALYALIISSCDAKVREEAVANMSMGEELLNLAMGDHSAKIKLLARKQVGVWLESDLSYIDALTKSRAGKPSELINLVSCSSKAVDKVFSSISDEQALLDIAISGMTSAIRQHAAENIHSRACLEDLLNSAKSKDKSVTQIAKAKLKVFKQAEVALAEKQQAAQSLCASLEALQKRKVDDYFLQRYQELERQWGALNDEEKAESKQRFQNANDSCQHIFELKNQRKQAELDKQAASEEAREAIVALQRKFTSLLAEIVTAEHLEGEAIQSQVADYASQLKDIQQANPSLGDQCKACYASRETAESLLADIEANGSLAQLLHALDGADEQSSRDISRRVNRLLRYRKYFGDEPPTLLDEASKAVQVWSQAKKAKTDDENRLLKNIQDLQRKATWAIDQGRLRQARGIYRELTEKREMHANLPAGLVRRLDELDEAMEKLGDWYEFAVHPKKQALVEKMEALVESELHPNDLSDRIKVVQEEWKTLSKGGKSQDEDLWQRFQGAADKAFEPCRKYFDGQAKEREGNAEKRQEIIAQLHVYYASYGWESPVWKDVDQILNTAYDNWKNIWPVPRKDIKTLQKKFDEVMKKILAKLEDARAINYQAKGDLIKQAEGLLERDDVASMTGEAKRLQSAWKGLGSTGGRGRSEDQKLWQKFRAVCDQIFERRQKENQAVQEKYNSERENANNLLQKLDNILSKNGQDFLEGRKKVADVQKEFLNVGELLDKEKHRMQGELDKKAEQIEAKAKTIRHTQLLDSWEAVYQIANSLRAYEHAVINNSEEQDALDEVKAAIRENQNWPAGTQPLIEQRLNNAEIRHIDIKENEKTLRLLCIRKEISRGKGSPAEDNALRMEYQVAQLQQSFGNKGNSKDATEAMVIEWLAVPGLDEQRYEALFRRFMIS